MMELGEELLLIEIFRQKATAKWREDRAIQAMDRALDEKRDERRRDEEDQKFAAEIEAIATQERIAAFREKLDRYDTALVDALTENETRLGDVRKQREAMEAAAYRLPDGRCVFKTEDGRQVVDQNGAVLSPNVVSAESIPDGKPRWEAFRASGETEAHLTAEREDLHRFQKRVDEARDRVDGGNLTAKKLEDLGADLDRAMPEAVRRRIGDRSAVQDLPDPRLPQAMRSVSTPGPGMGS